jgi:CHASE1-domain containing sensor protein
MYMPIYATHQPPDTVTQRRSTIVGWVAASFRLADVIRGLAHEFDTDLALAIHDGPSVAGGVSLFASHVDYAPHAVNGGLESVRSLDVGGRRWTLV